MENKCRWMDEAKYTILPNHACCHCFCHPSWIAAVFHLYTVTAFCLQLAATVPLAKTKSQINSQTDRGLKDWQLSSCLLHQYRFVICEVTQDISQLCLPWTLPWVFGGMVRDCACDCPFTDTLPLHPLTYNPPRFLILALTLSHWSTI